LHTYYLLSFFFYLKSKRILDINSVLMVACEEKRATGVMIVTQ